MKTTCTVLCENTAGFPFKVVGEHGLSILIERDRQKVLFDTGQGLGLVSNAACMGKDLASVDRVVLSHGHYDHTGGLRDFLEAGGPATVFAHPDALEPKFAQMGPDTPPCPWASPFPGKSWRARERSSTCPPCSGKSRLKSSPRGKSPVQRTG